jgi:hypothetical protein
MPIAAIDHLLHLGGVTAFFSCSIPVLQPLNKGQNCSARRSSSLHKTSYGGLKTRSIPG